MKKMIYLISILIILLIINSINISAATNYYRLDNTNSQRITALYRTSVNPAIIRVSGGQVSYLNAQGQWVTRTSSNPQFWNVITSTNILTDTTDTGVTQITPASDNPTLPADFTDQPAPPPPPPPPPSGDDQLTPPPPSNIPATTNCATAQGVGAETPHAGCANNILNSRCYVPPTTTQTPNPTGSCVSSGAYNYRTERARMQVQRANQNILQRADTHIRTDGNGNLQACPNRFSSTGCVDMTCTPPSSTTSCSFAGSCTQTECTGVCSRMTPPIGATADTLVQCQSLVDAVNTEASRQQQYFQNQRCRQMTFGEGMAVGAGVWGMMEGWDNSEQLFSWMGYFNDLFATSWGMAISGQWEQSICTIQSDYQGMNANGVLMTAGAGSVAAWITGEVTIIRHPSEENPEEIVLERIYKIEMSLNPSGLIQDQYLDSNCKVDFYITADGVNADINQDGTRDRITVTCVQSYSLTGSNALIFSTTSNLKEVCIKFDGTSEFRSDIREVLNGDRVCNDIVVVGTPADLGDCSYCVGTGDSFDIGIDLPSLDLGGGGGDDDGEVGEDVNTNTPMPPSPSGDAAEEPEENPVFT